MSDKEIRDIPKRSFWVISGIALIWNMIGIATYLMTVTISIESLELMPIDERTLYTEVPLLVTSAYAIAVFGGTLACILLLLRKSLSVAVFILSLIAIIIQMGHALLISSLLEVQGLSASALPILLITIAAYLVWYSDSVRKKGWIA
jgi:hypothetical protein